MRIELPSITPGDWQQAGDSVESEGFRIADICTQYNDNAGASGANQQAISALPSLLSALAYTLPHLQEYVEHHHKYCGGCSVEMEQARDLCREALEKAGCKITD